MPLLAPNRAQKFIPKTIKFSQLYKTGTNGGKPGYSVMSRAKEALIKAGYGEKSVSRMITKDAKIPVTQMKAIATLMNKAGIYGFQKSPEYLIKQFLTKERVKAQSIARIRREHIIEASQENLESRNSISLNSRDRSLRDTKPISGAANRTRSLSKNSISEKVSSLSAKAGNSGSPQKEKNVLRPNF